MQKMGGMDFNKVHYLMMVAELKSFSKAAEQCFISQPALTRCIKNMEEELGVKLFDRSCSPIRLTYAGERYLAGMRKILELKGQLDQEMEEIASAKKDRLILGMPSTRCHTWLPRILPTFQEENPGIEVQLVEGNGMNLEQMLRKETIDLFFICTLPILTEDLEFVPFCDEEMTEVVSRKASIFAGIELPPNQHGVLQYVPPKLLERLPFFSATSSQGTYYLSRRLFEMYHIQPEISMELINTTTAYRLAPESKGFALAPVSVTYEEQFHPEPIFCSMEEKPTVRTMGLLYKRNRQLSYGAQRFIDLAAREIPKFVAEHIPRFEVRHDIDFSSLL